MRKYQISEDFHLLSHYKAPMNNVVLPVLKFGSLLLDLKIKRTEGIIISEEEIDSFDGHKLKALIFQPQEGKDFPCLVYYHGGGFVTRAISLHYELAQRYAKNTNCVVVLVDYRLSPKYQYPIPENDCFETYKWVLANSDKLKINCDKMAIGGDSAGGSLTLSTLRRIIDDNIVKPRGQMLIYPVIDNKENRPSMETYQDTPVWNAVNNHKMWEYHLNNQNFDDPFNDKYMVKSYIEIAEYDCLHDEGKDYYQFLNDNHVDVILHEPKGTIHGYDFILRSDITKDSIKRRINFLNELFK